MPRRKGSSRKNNDAKESSSPVSETVVKESLEAHQLLPDYQPIDFSATPNHMEVINKKIRNTRKKLRKMVEIEQALAQGSKKITQEQQDSLAFKASIERNLADFEEIKKSLEKLDLSMQLRLLLGVYFAAAKTNSESLTGLSAILLPPSDPPAGYNPLKELQHACSVAELFLAGKSEELFHDPPVTFQQLQDEVKEFLIPKEEDEEEEQTSSPVEPEVAAKEEETETVEQQEEATESEQTPVQSTEEPNAAEEVEIAVAESNDVESKPDDSSVETQEKNEQKQGNKKRNNRRRGKGDGERVYSPKSGRGRKTEQGDDRENKNKGERGEKSDRRGRGRGSRGGRGRGGSNYRGKRGGDSTTKEAQPPK